ncbi:MAG: hypothetical protein ACRYGB_01750 [Janthinobacterium lividum]
MNQKFIYKLPSVNQIHFRENLLLLPYNFLFFAKTDFCTIKEVLQISTGKNHEKCT